MKAFRHVVNVMRPPTTTDEAGGLIGQPIAVRRSVPCSIRNLTGREAEQVHSTWPAATQIVEFYADPLRQVTANDYLTGGSLGSRLMSDGTTQDRKLYVVDVKDDEEKRLILTLICEEAK